MAEIANVSWIRRDIFMERPLHRLSTRSRKKKLGSFALELWFGSLACSHKIMRSWPCIRDSFSTLIVLHRWSLKWLNVNCRLIKLWCLSIIKVMCWWWRHFELIRANFRLILFPFHRFSVVIIIFTSFRLRHRVISIFRSFCYLIHGHSLHPLRDWLVFESLTRIREVWVLEWVLRWSKTLLHPFLFRSLDQIVALVVLLVAFRGRLLRIFPISNNLLNWTLISLSKDLIRNVFLSPLFEIFKFWELLFIFVTYRLSSLVSWCLIQAIHLRYVAIRQVWTCNRSITIAQVRELLLVVQLEVLGLINSLQILL